MLLKIVIFVILVLDLLALFSIIFIEKKNPNAALSWIIIILVFPIMGYLLYLFLGSSAKLRLTRDIYKINFVEEECIKEIKKRISLPNNKKSEELFKMNYNNIMNSYTVDNDVLLFDNMNEAISSLFKDVLNAKESINVTFFIFKSDSAVGNKFINILCKKALEGVKVKFTYDIFGSILGKKKDFDKLKECGVEVYRHLPKLWKSILEINYRNHRKMVIIDGFIAYTGGMNIGDEYLSMDKKIYPWKDTFVKITGSSVNFLQLRFYTDFIYLKKMSEKIKSKKAISYPEIKMLFKEPIKKGNMGVQIVSNGPDTEFSYVRDGYIKIINDSKKYVYIETPYLIPDESLLDSLRMASKSGKDVRIVIPGIPDKKFVYYVTLAFANELLKYGVKIYIYNGFIHSKNIVSDNIITSLGTTNFDVRSFRLNYEVNLFIKSEKFCKSNKKNILFDIKNSEELTLESYKKIGKLRKCMALIYRLFSPVL